MRIAVMGSGAVGGHFGAKLAAAGHQVAFIARGKHLAALQMHGLKVISPNGDLNIHRAQFTADAQEVGKVELILFCVKSYDTEIAAEAVKPIVSDKTTILSLQNGIDNPEKLARVYGADRILPAVVYVGAQMSAPGVISHSTGGRIIFGQMDGTVGDAAKALVQTLTAARIPCEASAEIGKVQWTKLLWNAPICAISCLARANTKQIVESASLTKLALDCMAEVQAAARTQAVELARQIFDDTIEFSKTLGNFKPSMLQDLEANKPLEYEAFNGIVVKLLEAAGEPAPINKTFYATLKFLDDRIRRAAQH
ncbi:MAG: 2-dehydropantoate 2-reductase [Deltaproteobacteria bacterium]|nr:2-dehydropantoate 2-reductase [Deltaproteobacteria bacterium]